MSEGELPEIETQESWGSKHGQAYEVANGEEIDNKGEKKFVGHIITVEGQESGGKGFTAQACDVQRPFAARTLVWAAIWYPWYRCSVGSFIAFVFSHTDGQEVAIAEL